MYPWESANDSVAPRGNPQFSVPVQGSLAPGFAVSYGALPDSFNTLANPVPADARSLDNGKKLYQINCSVCHGLSGNAGAPIQKYGVFAPPITSALTRGRSDGYIWGIIRNGRAAMPPYPRIEEGERWDIVNYVRALAGAAAGASVDTVLAGLPGETGNSLPRYSEMGPTRPSPYYRHFGMQAGTARRGVQPTPSPADTTAGDRAAAGTTTGAVPATDTTRNRGQQP